MGGFRDERVEPAGGKPGAVEDALGGKEHVAGEEDATVLVHDLDARGAGHVAGGMEGELNLIARPAEALGLVERVRVHPRRDPVDLVVGEEGVVGDALLLALAKHDVGGIVQHALDEHAARQRHDGGPASTAAASRCGRGGSG